MSTEESTSESSWGVCQDALAAIIRISPAARLAIENSFSGPRTGDRVEDMIEDFLDWISEKDREVPDMIDQLKGLYESVLHTILDYDDLKEMANKMNNILDLTASGDTTLARQIIDANIHLDPASQPESSAPLLVSPSADEASAASSTSQSPAPSSTVDEDGWVTVKRGGKNK